MPPNGRVRKQYIMIYTFIHLLSFPAGHIHNKKCMAANADIRIVSSISIPLNLVKRFGEYRSCLTVSRPFDARTFSVVSSILGVGWEASEWSRTVRKKNKK